MTARATLRPPALAALALVAGAALGVAHGAPPPGEAVGFQLSGAPRVAGGGRSELAVVLRVTDGYAVLSHQERAPGLVAAKIEVRGVKSVTLGAPRFPKGRLFKAGGKRLNAYQGDITVRIPFTVSRNLAPGLRQLEGTLTYQVCSAAGCFDAVRLPLALRFEITD